MSQKVEEALFWADYSKLGIREPSLATVVAEGLPNQHLTYEKVTAADAIRVLRKLAKKYAKKNN